MLNDRNRTGYSLERWFKGLLRDGQTRLTKTTFREMRSRLLALPNDGDSQHELIRKDLVEFKIVSRFYNSPGPSGAVAASAGIHAWLVEVVTTYFLLRMS